MDIISAYREAGTYRGAAAISGTTPKTVRRVIARHEAGGGAPARSPRGRNYDVVAGLVAERVGKTAGRISAKRLLPAARAAGYAGSPRNFRRLVAAQKQAWRRDHHRGRRPAVWSPGEYLVIDWGAEGGLHVFCAVLAWSRVRFVRFAADERAATTLAMLAQCLEVLGGVPGKVLADRMGCLKGGVVANVVVPAPEYLRFAAHYGFRPDFCEATDPESKGIAENLVGYAKSDLMVPQAPFGDLAAANAAAAAWCAEVNGAVHSEICAVPAERLVTERELLAPLPSLRASTGRQVMRKVDKLSCVRFGSARYSVPVRLIGTQVAVRAGDGRLLVAVTATGQVVAEHILVAPGEASVLDEHYGGPRPAPRRAVRPKTAAEKAFCALGPVAEAFITGAAAAGHTRLGTRAGRAEYPARRPRRARVPRRAGPGGRVQPVARRRRALHSRCRARHGRSPGRRGRAGARAARRPGPPAVRLRHRRAGMTAAAPPLAPDLTEGLRRLKLAAMRRLAPELLLTAKTQRWAPEELLRTLVEAEISARDASNARTRLKAAAFPVTKTLDEFDLGVSSVPQGHLHLPRLAGMDHAPARICAWSARPARARATCSSRSASPPSQAGHKVRYFTAAELTETLYRGLADNSVGRVIDTLLRNDLILIDEVGFAPLDDTGAQLLFRVVAAAYERRALGIASHWPFESWGRFLPEHTTAVSLLDRLLHHANVVVTDGDSYRMREARAKGGTTLNKT